MNIHEYQAKSILRNCKVAVPVSQVADTPGKAREAALWIREKTGTDSWAVKAQIHAGGRGKGGGVKIAGSVDEVFEYARDILGMNLVTPQTGPEGKKVLKVLVEQGIYYEGESEIREFYVGMLLNRETGRNVIMYSTRGGMDIETVAADTPHLIFTEEIDPLIGLQAFQARRIAFNLGLSGQACREMIRFILALYRSYESADALLVEINPVIKTSDDRIFAADAKITLDDNGLYRHPDYAEMRDVAEEDPAEVEAGKHNLNFIKLDGNVGCMVNGAGLAMATMDIIRLSGGHPANFLDVGGTANARTVEAGFRIISTDPGVQAILINIFGGIVRCDRVAQGVVDAHRSIGRIKVPVIVRLQGTNAEEARVLIDGSGLSVRPATTLQEAAELVTGILSS